MPAAEGVNALGRATRMTHETYAALGILGILLLGNSASRMFQLGFVQLRFRIPDRAFQKLRYLVMLKSLDLEKIKDPAASGGKLL